FHGGTKLDDLIEFILWRDLADKYNVQVTPDLIKEYISEACHGPMWNYDNDAAREVQARVRATHYGASDSIILRALRDEFRVQIMQLALIGRWSTGPRGEREELAKIPLGASHLYLNTPMQIRVAPTPEQISAEYRKMRTELVIDLLPVSLEALAKQVK